MQTTLTATLIEQQANIEDIKFQLDKVVVLHNHVQKKLYAEIMQYFKINSVSELPRNKINQLKSSYQLKHNINARQYESIYIDLKGKISSILELNKSYLADTKDNIESLSKAIRSKKKQLAELTKKLLISEYIGEEIDIVNFGNIKKKLFYLKQKLSKSNNKLSRLNDIEKTGNPHLCFGSKKLFNQQFQINSNNNLTSFKKHNDWKKSWIESRNNSFYSVGSSDETTGNTNCQIKKLMNNIYELKLNINPNATKHSDKYISFKIAIHNDNKNLISNILDNDQLLQALTYRFYKVDGKYRIFIALDKSKQTPAVVSSKILGSVGVDINANHLSVSEIDRFGNLVKSFDVQLDLKDKTSQQAKNNIALAVKEITNYAVKVNKPIVIEKLDFTNKKKQLKDSFNKKYNVMLSSFAYSKIIELIKSRCFDKGIEVIEVNPAYTSKVGKFKYQNQYKLTTHQAAAFVIARRGLLSYQKTVKIKVKQEDKEKIINIVNKEKTISIRCSQYYSFVLPVRNIQRKNNTYWKEVEQNYQKVKKHKVSVKRKKRTFILAKQDLIREITLVADNFGVNRDSNPNLLFQPF